VRMGCAKPPSDVVTATVPVRWLRHTTIDNVLPPLKSFLASRRRGRPHAVAFLATDDVTLRDTIHAKARPQLTVVHARPFGDTLAVIAAAAGSTLVRSVPLSWISMLTRSQCLCSTLCDSRF
jgi:hypothetical protein